MSCLEVITQSEHQVIALLIAGKSTKEVAIILNKSANTVRTQKANIYKKLNVSNLAQLIGTYTKQSK